GPGREVTDQAEGKQQQEADMDAAHHLARQIIAGRDIELEHGEQDADGVSEPAPYARTKPFRKTVFEIIELDPDRPFRCLGLLHCGVSPVPSGLISLGLFVMAGLVPAIHVLFRVSQKRGWPGLWPRKMRLAL